MTKIHLDWSDGRYSTRQLTDEEAAASEAAGCDVVHVEDRIWAAYLSDCERDGIWQAFWRSISNELYMRRREKELRPLEDAEREIARLKADLERSQRLEQFYETQYAGKLSEEHRDAYEEFTCVYPQPGCRIDALPEEWREAAQDILEGYRPEWAKGEDGMKYQGCCCGHTHKLLADPDAQKLRDAGFLVENDSNTL